MWRNPGIGFAHVTCSQGQKKKQPKKVTRSTWIRTSNDEHKNCEDEHESSSKKSITKERPIYTWTIRQKYPLKFKSSRWHSEKQQTSGCLQIWFVLRAATLSNKTASIKLFQFDCDSSLVCAASIPSTPKPEAFDERVIGACCFRLPIKVTLPWILWHTSHAKRFMRTNRNGINLVEHVSGVWLFVWIAF